MRTSAEQEAFFKGLINFMPVALKRDHLEKSMAIATKELTHTYAQAVLAAHGVPCVTHRIGMGSVAQVIWALRPDITNAQMGRELRMRARQIFDLDREDVHALGYLQYVGGHNWDTPSPDEAREIDRILGPQEVVHYRYFRFGNSGVPAPSLLVEIEELEWSHWHPHVSIGAVVLASPLDAFAYHERANELFTQIHNDAVKLTGDPDFIHHARLKVEKERKERRGY